MVSAIGARGFAAIGVAAALLAGCAGDPNTTVMALGAGVPADAKTFALAEPGDEAGRLAAPHVSRRLQELGYEPAADPDLLVEIGGAERGRAIGAYIPGCDAAVPDWVEPREDKWIAGGGSVLTLNVRLVDAETGAPLYYASSRRQASGSFDADHAAKLAQAALAANPRRAARAFPPSC